MEELLRLYSKLAQRRGKQVEAEKSLFRIYFINPLSAGLFGFAVFLFFEVLFVIGADFLGLISNFKIGLLQIAIAGLGFILQFVFQLFKNFQ